MRARRPVTAIAAVAGFAALALAGCNGAVDPGLQGWVEAEMLFVGPDDPGRVETLSVREGDKVEPGAPLFAVDDQLQQADVNQIMATLTNMQRNLERARDLLKTNAGTQKAYDDAIQSQRETEARLNSAKTRLARRKVASPAAGTIQQIYFRPGEMVPAGRPVVALLPPGNVKLRFFVPEAALPTIALGDTIAVQCDGCAPDLTAKVSFISRSVEYTPPVIYSLDERSKLVFMIEARPQRPDHLRVGQPVTVRLAAQAAP
ncbi:MAG TPA: efflux RND transporter periplasmic adaptor subunit [Xanthobacteraceae bacterium]|jgi:HlyD family secretion protein|nr:efflux RND transporter periplasmic adaptor subunit [Xanthobacteraceae bacterium]